MTWQLGMGSRADVNLESQMMHWEGLQGLRGGLQEDQGTLKKVEWGNKGMGRYELWWDSVM